MKSETSASYSSPKRTAVDDDEPEPEPDIDLSDVDSEHENDDSNNDDDTSDEQEPNVEQERIQERTSGDEDEGGAVEQVENVVAASTTTDATQVVEEEPEPDVPMLLHDTTNASTGEEKQVASNKIGGLQIDTTGEEGRQQTALSPVGPSTPGGTKSVNWTQDTKDAAAVASSPTEKKSPRSSKSPQRRKTKNTKHHAHDTKGGDRRIKLTEPLSSTGTAPTVSQSGGDYCRSYASGARARCTKHRTQRAAIRSP